MAQQPKLLDQVRDAIRLKHDSIHTERAYMDWIKCFILFHHKRYPNDMEVPEGQQDRVTTLPQRAMEPLRCHQDKVQALHQQLLHHDIDRTEQLL